MWAAGEEDLWPPVTVSTREYPVFVLRVRLFVCLFVSLVRAPPVRPHGHVHLREELRLHRDGAEYLLAYSLEYPLEYPLESPSSPPRVPLPVPLEYPSSTA
jgi:hypothetical protein